MPRDDAKIYMTFPRKTPNETPLQKGQSVIGDMAAALRLVLEFSYVMEAREKANHRDYQENINSIMGALANMYDGHNADENGRYEIGSAAARVDGIGYRVRTTIERVYDHDE